MSFGITVSGPYDASQGKLEEVNITPAGQDWTMSWDGPRPVIEQMIGLISLSADAVQYRSKGGSAVITARYSGPQAGITELPEYQVELDTGEQTISLFAHPDYVGLTETVVKVIQTAVSDAKESAEDIAAIGAAGGGANAIDLYKFLIRGMDSYFEPMHVVTRTRTVSRRYSTAIDQANMNRIFTTAQLSAVLGTQLLWGVPGLTLTAAEIAFGFKPGWRKKEVRIVDAARRQRQMVEVWQLAKWAKHYQWV